MSATVITYAAPVGRWEPDSRGRLLRAALDLFDTQGYEQTTTAQIAEAAGLTERTFFRHFTDKREVLFAGGPAYEELLTAAVAGAPPGATPWDAATAAAHAAAARIQEHPDGVVRRQRVIASHPELQERDLAKNAGLAAAVVRALRERGTPDATAELAAALALTGLTVALREWAQAGARGTLTSVLTRTLAGAEAISRPA
ncbi:TetR/AcrR family transcriptional regulator [Cellulomonas sp. ES6]|uniref:TetR/AcrR family transcriptional regulator n=1 Tax=Cellulomonas sp. ES6 TaxID=3039384 RepID=UPI0024B71495|nr:TetR/AcrR family transcriptional regulator [Cellulomonas sp. ES6]WHP16834.1 helix-turn-helix domain-containing protein [Cellulomonas sp. ES6]